MASEKNGAYALYVVGVAILFSFLWFSPAHAICTPLGSVTSQLGLCKPQAGEVGWSSAVNQNWDTVDANFGTIPSGSIMFYGGAAPPNGWYPCDGSAKSRTGDANLFAVYGTTYGVGDGSTTFNLPDGRSRNVIMAGTGAGLSTRNLADTGGEETHLLSIPEMPSHSHVETVGSGGSNGIGAGAFSSSPTASALSTQATGGGGTHNVMDPFITFTCMLKR